MKIRELLGGDKLLGNDKLWIIKPKTPQDDQKDNYNSNWDQVMKLLKQKHGLILSHRYLSTMIESKQQLTVFEEEQMMKIYEIQKKTAEGYVDKLVEAELESEKELKLADDEKSAADAEFNQLKQDKTSDKKEVNKLKQIVKAKQKKYRDTKNKHSASMRK